MREGDPNVEPKTTTDSETPGNNEQHKKPTKEELEILECFTKDHPKSAVQVETRRHCEKEKDQFLRMVDEFMHNNSLERLNAVLDVSPALYDLLVHYKGWTAEKIETALTNLTPEDATKYKDRLTANNDLIPIVALMNKIEKETDITQAEFAKLEDAYKKLSRAVGIINNNKVDHTR